MGVSSRLTETTETLSTLSTLTKHRANSQMPYKEMGLGHLKEAYREKEGHAAEDRIPDIADEQTRRGFCS